MSKERTSDKILEYIEKHKKVSPKELVEEFLISPRAIFKQLKKLFDQNLIIKIGVPPKVFYSLAPTKTEEEKIGLNSNLRKVLQDHFYIVTPLGRALEGIEGFKYWCDKRGLSVEKTAVEYKRTIDKYQEYAKDGLIDGTSKLKGTFELAFLDELYYLDFYAIERFGKTKLGFMLLLAKQSQNRAQIKTMIEIIHPIFEQLIKSKKIDCLGFIPPTVKRELQIMNEFKKHLHFNLPLLNLIKVKTEIVVPQKTLSKLEDRIENAKNTMIVDDKRQFKNILLIDDAVGSGATLNEVGRQIKEKKLCKNLIGLAITGSFKGFDVISEV